MPRARCLPFGDQHSRLTISCRMLVGTTNYRRRAELFIVDFREKQSNDVGSTVEVFGRGKNGRMIQERVSIWRVGVFRARDLSIAHRMAKYERIYRTYRSHRMLMGQLQDTVRRLELAREWHVNTRYRYLHVGTVQEAVEYFPGWIDGYAYPWVFDLPLRCTRKRCQCDGNPARMAI